MASSLPIKGVRDGLLVHLPEGQWEQVRPLLLRTIDERADFFRGARLALQLEARSLGASDLARLRDELAEREVSLWAVLSTEQATRSAAADLGLAVALDRRGSAEAEAEDDSIESVVDGGEALLVARTLRSGHRIRHPGHVVVIGDVNPGAEIIAGGHVIVWGRLRGTVHAGAAGDAGASVFALDLAPTQLRIAGQIAVSPDRRGKPRPEMARIRDGKLVAEAWQAGGRPS
jgi:septum site-determining protein MinC